MKITLGRGIEEVQFDNNKDEVIKLWGEPDKVYNTDLNNIRFQYFSKLVELSFEPENNDLLGWMEIKNSRAEIYGMNIIGLVKEIVLEHLKLYMNEVAEFQDYGSMESFYYEKNCLEIQFEFGVCTSINFGS